MAKLSRRKIAQVWADELLAGRDMTTQIAAYLVNERRTDEAELIVRDTEAALADRGVAVADITTAGSLSADAKKAIQTFLSTRLGAQKVALRETTDPTVIGGVRIDTAGKRLDATLATRLGKLKASKI